MRIFKGVIGFVVGLIGGTFCLVLLATILQKIFPQLELETLFLPLMIGQIAFAFLGCHWAMSTTPRQTSGSYQQNVSVRTNNPVNENDTVWNAQLDYVGRGVDGKGIDVQIKAETREAAIDKAKAVASQLMEEKESLEAMHDCQISGIEIKKVHRIQ